MSEPALVVPGPILDRVVRNVRTLLTAEGKTAREMGAYCGYSETVISLRLGPRRDKLKVAELLAFAEFLKVEPSVLLLPTEELVRSRCSSPLAGQTPHRRATDLRVVHYLGEMELPLVWATRTGPSRLEAYRMTPNLMIGGTV